MAARGRRPGYRIRYQVGDTDRGECGRKRWLAFRRDIGAQAGQYENCTWVRRFQGNAGARRGAGVEEDELEGIGDKSESGVRGKTAHCWPPRRSPGRRFTTLARAWAAGAGPGDAPFTIDLDSTICETYGLAKEGARHHGYTGQRGYHPLLAVAAGTGDVLMSRLREGRANTARGAAHFLRETVGRVRHAGATGQLTVRADSGFYTHGVVSVCRKTKVRFSITIRQRASLRNLIKAIPEDAWTPIPYWMEGAADVAETTYTPFGSKPYAAPVRLIVRRVKPTPDSQLALFASYSYHGFITDRDGDTLDLEADHRRHAEIENAIRDLKYGVGLNHLPSGRFAANAAWLAVQVMAHNLARWTARIGLGEQIVTTKTLRRRFFSLAGRLTRKTRRLTLHLPQQWPWETQFTLALARLRALPLPA